MNRIRAFLAVASSLALVIVVAPARASAVVVVPDLPALPGALDDADRQRARRAYADARELAGRGRLKEALRAAELAHGLLANPSTAMARAAILDELGRRTEAFEELLSALDLSPSDAERRLVEERLSTVGRALDPPLGWIVLVARPEDAIVSVDGERFVGSRTVGVSAGRHVVRVSAPGYTTVDAAFEVTGGRGDRLMFRLTPQATVLPRKAGWALLGSGLVLTGVGLGVHAWTEVRADEASAQESRGIPSRARDDATLGTALTAAMYGVGGAALISGVVLLAVTRDEAAAPPGTPTLGPTAGASTSGAWVGVGGGF